VFHMKRLAVGSVSRKETSAVQRIPGRETKAGERTPRPSRTRSNDRRPGIERRGLLSDAGWPVERVCRWRRVALTGLGLAFLGLRLRRR